MASTGRQVLIGAWLNLSALARHIRSEGKDLLVLCAGWKNKFNLEDTLFAGALAQQVLQEDGFYTICDATLGAIDLFEAANKDMMGYIEKVAQRHRLKKNNLDDVIGYCHETDRTGLIPVLEGNSLVLLNNHKQKANE
jgi:2-phosphosulfolactate phosphatase